MNDKSMPVSDEQGLAESTGRFMYARDSAAQKLGIILQATGPGYSCMHLKVQEDMLNGHRICHGGYIFTLADTAFAYACNSYNRVTVAAGAVIDFLAPARLGDELIAIAQEQTLSGRTGVYDVVVSNQDDQRIALFRGRSYRIQGLVIPESDS